MFALLIHNHFSELSPGAEAAVTTLDLAGHGKVEKANAESPCSPRAANNLTGGKAQCIYSPSILISPKISLNDDKPASHLPVVIHLGSLSVPVRYLCGPLSARQETATGSTGPYNTLQHYSGPVLTFSYDFNFSGNDTLDTNSSEKNHLLALS